MLSTPSIVAAFVAHACVVVAFGLIVDYLRNRYDSFIWGDFGLHPMLMSLAFIIGGPLGAMSYSVYERMMGLSHARAKLLHAVVQFFGVCCAVAGLLTMVESHAEVQNFQSLHSWIGVVVVVIYFLHWSSSAIVFYGTVQFSFHEKLKARFMHWHIFGGVFVVFGGMLTVLTGILLLTGKYIELEGDDRTQYFHINAGAFCVFVAMVAMFYVIYERRSGARVNNNMKVVDAEGGKDIMPESQSMLLPTVPA